MFGEFRKPCIPLSDVKIKVRDINVSVVLCGSETKGWV